MYLAKTGPVYPTIQDVDEERLCGECGERPATWGDWLCEHCRRKLDEVWHEAREHLIGAVATPQ